MRLQSRNVMMRFEPQICAYVRDQSSTATHVYSLTHLCMRLAVLGVPTLISSTDETKLLDKLLRVELGLEWGKRTISSGGGSKPGRIWSIDSTRPTPTPNFPQLKSLQLCSLALKVSRLLID